MRAIEHNPWAQILKRNRVLASAFPTENGNLPVVERRQRVGEHVVG